MEELTFGTQPTQPEEDALTRVVETPIESIDSDTEWCYLAGLLKWATLAHHRIPYALKVTFPSWIVTIGGDKPNELMSPAHLHAASALLVHFSEAFPGCEVEFAGETLTCFGGYSSTTCPRCLGVHPCIVHEAVSRFCDPDSVTLVRENLDPNALEFAGDRIDEEAVSYSFDYEHARGYITDLPFNVNIVNTPI